MGMHGMLRDAISMQRGIVLLLAYARHSRRRSQKHQTWRETRVCIRSEEYLQAAGDTAVVLAGLFPRNSTPAESPSALTSFPNVTGRVLL